VEKLLAWQQKIEARIFPNDEIDASEIKLDLARINLIYKRNSMPEASRNIYK
jgi:hypothetical protein